LCCPARTVAAKTTIAVLVSYSSIIVHPTCNHVHLDRSFCRRSLLRIYSRSCQCRRRRVKGQITISDKGRNKNCSMTSMMVVSGGAGGNYVTPVKAAAAHQHDTTTFHNKATDETLSTTNCDDSLSTLVKEDRMSPLRRKNVQGPPPMYAVNVDKRSVRQRLRDQEAKIAFLLQPRSSGVPATNASDGVLLKLVQTLENDLKKTEQEKTRLQEKLEQLEQKQQQQEQGDDHASISSVGVEEHSQAATVEAAATSAEGAEALAGKVTSLQLELRRKTHEILLLHDRWETTLHTMVKYQVDLETHDLHYTDYAAQQFQCGKETLQEFRDLTAQDQPPATRQLGKQAKHMMSTLLNDLEVLGERYQESRINHELQLAHYKQRQLEWQHRATVLEATLQEHKLTIPEILAAVPLVQQKEELQSSTPKQAQDDDDMYDQVEAATEISQHVQMERDALQEEVTRLQQTVSQLQSVTQQQQEALEKATVAMTAPPRKKKKWFSSFGKKKQNKPPAVVLSPPINVAAALAPMQVESERFNRIKEALQSQRQAFEKLRKECVKQRRQTAQLKATVTELRLEQHTSGAEKECRALNDIQALFDELQMHSRNEQAAVQMELQLLRAQLKDAGRAIPENV
jgi:hypothetical protein